MMNSRLVFYAVMCLLSCIQMPVYCRYKVKGKGTAYTVSKCAGSLIFLITSVAALFLQPIDAYSILIVVGMVFSLAGDYLLSMTSHHRLKVGGVTFMTAHVCFIAAFIYLSRFHWQTIPVIILLFILEIFAAKLFKLKTRGASKEMAVYIITVTTMAVTAGAMLFADSYRVAMSDISRNMTIAGAVLFLVSDCFWMTYGMAFRSAKPALKIANVLTYFPAQMLIAGALLFRW